MGEFDDRLRQLETFKASADTTFLHIAEFMREQVKINDRLNDKRLTVWGYAVGFIGMLVGLISLIWSIKK